MKARKVGAPRRVGRWLFQDLKKASWGFAEVDAQFTNFTRISVVLSSCALAGGWEHPLAREALSLLISGLIIMTKADVVTLVPTSDAVEGQLAGLGFGDARNLWSPYLALARLDSERTGLKIQTRDVDATRWWEKAENDRKILAYLEKRRESEELAKQPPRKKAPGMLARLNRLLRWD